MKKVQRISGLRVNKGGKVNTALLKAVTNGNNDKLLLKHFPGLQTKSGQVHQGKLNSYKKSIEFYAKGVTSVAVADFGVSSYNAIPAGFTVKKSWLGGNSKEFFGDKYLTAATVEPKRYLK